MRCCGRRRAAAITVGVLLVTVAAVLGRLAWRQTVLVSRGQEHFAVEEITIPIEGLPRELNGTRIVQLSDLHMDVPTCQQVQCSNAMIRCCTHQ